VSGGPDDNFRQRIPGRAGRDFRHLIRVDRDKRPRDGAPGAGQALHPPIHSHVRVGNPGGNGTPSQRACQIGAPVLLTTAEMRAVREKFRCCGRQ
jgi:hypothetical protein